MEVEYVQKKTTPQVGKPFLCVFFTALRVHTRLTRWQEYLYHRGAIHVLLSLEHIVDKAISSSYCKTSIHNRCALFAQLSKSTWSTFQLWPVSYGLLKHMGPSWNVDHHHPLENLTGASWGIHLIKILYQRLYSINGTTTITVSS